MTEPFSDRKRYVYISAYGICSNLRFNDNEGRTKDENRRCRLILMRVTADGTKELIAAVDGHRVGELSWKGVLLSLHARGLIYTLQWRSVLEHLVSGRCWE